MAIKVKKVNTKTWKGKKLMILDVSAIMRTHYIPLESTESAQATYFNIRNKHNPYKRKALTVTIDGEEVNTSALYGLMAQIKKYGTDMDYIFCFDTGRNLLKKVNTSYKKNRVQMGSDYYDQVNNARVLLRKSGFKVMEQEGYEGDHMVFKAHEANKDKYDHIGIVTNDYDMTALVDEKTVWLNTTNKKTDITQDNYTEVLDCPYNTIHLKKALVGDKSDGILGVRGFGKVAYSKFLMEIGEDIDKVHNNEAYYIENSMLLTELQKAEALESLALIKPLQVEDSGLILSEVNERIFKQYLNLYAMASIVKCYEK